MRYFENIIRFEKQFEKSRIKGFTQCFPLRIQQNILQETTDDGNLIPEAIR